MIHCISGQPDVIRCQLPCDNIIFHNYESPLPTLSVGGILIFHEPSRPWLTNPPRLPTSTHRILLAENPSAGDIKAAVNRLGIARVTDLAGLSASIKSVLQLSALSVAQSRIEDSAL